MPAFFVKRKFPETLTLTHLLTHTSGFDVTDIGDAVRKSKDIIPLKKYVKEHMTPQIFPPGRYSVYTNHGFALMGYIIEAVSGMPFHEYMQKHIFLPLGMKRSSFAQPLPKTLVPLRAKGYRYSKKKYRALPMDYSNVAPADALMATGEDMGKFLVAHLNGGKSGSGKILGPKFMKLMHKPHFRYHPKIAGYALGFEEEFFSKERHLYGKRRLLSHTGGQLGFTSELILFPEKKLGIYICLNRRVGRLRREVVKQFLKRFYPYKSKLKSLGLKPVEKNNKFAGYYMRLGYPRHSLEKLVYMFSPFSTVQVIAQKDGSLRIGKQKALLQREPLLFQSKNGQQAVAFAQNSRKEVTRLYIGKTAFEKIMWFQNPQNHLSMFLYLTVLFLLSIFIWPFNRFQQSGEHEEGESTKGPIGPEIAKVLVVIVSAINTSFVFGVIFEVSKASGAGWDYGLPTTAKIILHLPFLSILFTAGLVGCLVLVFRHQYWSRFWRLFYGFITVCAVLFLPLIASWNLIGT